MGGSIRLQHILSNHKTQHLCSKPQKLQDLEASIANVGFKDILLEVTRFGNVSENPFGNTMVLFNHGSTHIKLQSFLCKNGAILTDAQWLMWLIIMFFLAVILGYSKHTDHK